MAISNREKYFTFALLLACALFVLDRIAIEPYLERRSALVQQRQKAQTSLTDAHQILRDERRLRKELAGMDAFFALDPSSAEGRLLQLLQQSEQTSGVSGASFQRVGIVEEHGFTRLTFQATVIGKMPSLAGFLYRVETASLPVRVDDVQVAPKQEAGDELQIHFSVSTLCRDRQAPRPQPEPASSVAVLDDAGARR
jgi:Tfp pilus assembly protein PilO